MTQKLPLFYFKSTLCFIDDDELFMSTVSDVFSRQYNCLTFTDPDKALHYLNHYRPTIANMSFGRELVENELYNIKNHHPFDMDISAISALTSLENKTNEITVLVIDYHMPGMNGIEFCQRLKHLPCKKILLTGEATLDEAVNAFNEGLIDRFIQKGVGVSDQLESYVKELNVSYFCDITQPVTDALQTSRRLLYSDPAFIQFFETLCQDNAVKEFYLISKQGNFLLVNQVGVQFYLICMSEQDRKDFYSVYDDLDATKQSFLNSIKEKDVIPYFGFNREPWEVDDAWDQYFYPAQKIQGKEMYLWVLLDKSLKSR